MPVSLFPPKIFCRSENIYILGCKANLDTKARQNLLCASYKQPKKETAVINKGSFLPKTIILFADH